MPVSLELGGKSPTIVLRRRRHRAGPGGRHVRRSSPPAARAASPDRGSSSHASLYDGVRRRTRRPHRELRVGPGTDPDTQVAPLVHHKHRDSVAAYVDLARAEGAPVLCGGAAPEGDRYRDGAYYLPTVLDGLPNTAAVCQEEIFGPVLVALPFDDEDDLVAPGQRLACTASPAGLWTRDHRPPGGSPAGSRRARSGSTPTSSSASPRRSAGMKDSGIGPRRAAT